MSFEWESKAFHMQDIEVPSLSDCMFHDVLLVKTCHPLISLAQPRTTAHRPSSKFPVASIPVKT